MHRLLCIAIALLATASSAQTTPVGLELRLVPVASTGATIGLSLRDYADVPTGLDEATLARLRAYGLRVVAVPIHALPDATRNLQPVGAVQTETLGMLYRWAPIVTGPELEEQYTTVESGPLQLPAGRFRLLARAWIVPDIDTAEDTGRVDARLRVELLPQHLEARRRRFDYLLDPAPRSLDDEGLLFHRLHAVTELPARHALVLVPAPPEVDWAALKEPAPVADALPQPEPTVGPDPDPRTPRERALEQLPIPRPERPLAEPERLPGSRGPFGAGPQTPSFRTLGEQLLRRPAGATENPGAPGTYTIEPERSLVVVLIPHVPARYALIP